MRDMMIRYCRECRHIDADMPPAVRATFDAAFQPRCRRTLPAMLMPAPRAAADEARADAVAAPRYAI